MRIIWNENEKQFEAQFAQGDAWDGDKDAAQGAGFRTDGPPAWVWRTSKASHLTKLKESCRPISGLSITREALDAYNRLLEVERKNDELREYVKQQKKQQKKAAELAHIEADSEGEQVEPEYEPQHYHEIPEYWRGKHEIGRGDLPADILARSVQREPVSLRTPRAVPTGTCVMCAGPVYFYEKQDPQTCLWCETRGQESFLDDMLDNSTESVIVVSAAGEDRLAKDS